MLERLMILQRHDQGRPIELIFFSRPNTRLLSSEILSNAAYSTIVLNEHDPWVRKTSV
jgi:hypothetical protein